jgi:hypothetical protein
MGFPLHIRRDRLADFRDRVLASGGGAVHVFGSAYPGADAASASAPLVIRSVGASDLVMHATDAYMSLNVEANVSVAGAPTWARFVDGSGDTVYDCEAGLPGSGKPLIASDGQVPPAAQLYPGGVLTLTIEFVEP